MKFVSARFRARVAAEGGAFTAQLLAVLKGLTSRVGGAGGHGVEYVLK